MKYISLFVYRLIRPNEPIYKRSKNHSYLKLTGRFNVCAFFADPEGLSLEKTIVPVAE